MVSLPGLAFAKATSSASVCHPDLRSRHQHLRHDGHQTDRDEIFQWVIGKIWRDLRRDGDWPHEPKKQGVAIVRRLRDGIGADGPAGAGLVLDDNRLFELFGQRLGNLAAHQIGWSAGGIGHHNLDDLGGIVLSLRRRHKDDE
jgi:hypothetical protein